MYRNGILEKQCTCEGLLGRHLVAKATGGEMWVGLPEEALALKEDSFGNYWL